jgi:hypothetical protein
VPGRRWHTLNVQRAIEHAVVIVVVAPHDSFGVSSKSCHQHRYSKNGLKNTSRVPEFGIHRNKAKKTYATTSRNVHNHGTGNSKATRINNSSIAMAPSAILTDLRQAYLCPKTHCR